MDRMRVSRRGISVALAVPICLIALASVAPLGVASSRPIAPTAVKPADARTTGGAGCSLINPQPAAPLEMNTVGMNGLFKTVAMEKEIFACQTAAAGPNVRDLETFIEIIESRRGQIVEIRPSTVTCVKEFQGGTVTCSNKDLNLGSTKTPLQGCDPASQYVPADPVVMNTEVGILVIKTIKVEKEVFKCGANLRDLYVFTEILERPTQVAGVGSTIRPISVKSFGVVCVKNVQAGAITGCQRFATT